MVLIIKCIPLIHNAEFSPQNIRLLHRAIYWAAGCEDKYSTWSSCNINTECAYYPDGKKLIIINNIGENEETVIIDNSGNKINVSLEPFDIKILDI